MSKACRKVVRIPTQTISAEDIRPFLEEDIGSGDVTAGLIPPALRAEAELITRQSMILCGAAWFDAVFKELDPEAAITWSFGDGDEAPGGARLCRIRGNARALLTGERTAINLLQTLSATATLARRYADAVEGTRCQVLDTRKTLPGLRKAQKYAVRCGGCRNHRFGLYDGILIKENHIAAAGSIRRALADARALGSALAIEVEIESLEEMREALDAGAHWLLLDNFTPQMLRAGVALNAGRAKLEASGNISLDNVREIAETGVDYISVGALTKNVQAADLSMRMTLAHQAGRTRNAEA